MGAALSPPRAPIGNAVRRAQSAGESSPASLLTTERANQIEQALSQLQRLEEGSRLHRSAEARLLELLRPFIEGAAHEAWEKGHPRTYLSRADLTQTGLMHAQSLWRGLDGGRAGPGRTLYPAYVLRAVRQEFSRVLAEARGVPISDWGRKLLRRAQARVALTGVTLEEALIAERASPATVLALTTPIERVPEGAALGCPDESERRRDDLCEQVRATEALRQLPRRQRLAVAGAMGLLREDGRRVADGKLAKALKCTAAEVRTAREDGLTALRQVLREQPRCPLLSLSELACAGRAAPLCAPATSPISARRWGRATRSHNAARRPHGIDRMLGVRPARAAPTSGRAWVGCGSWTPEALVVAGSAGRSIALAARPCNGRTIPLRFTSERGP